MSRGFIKVLFIVLLLAAAAGCVSSKLPEKTAEKRAVAVETSPPETTIPHTEPPATPAKEEAASPAPADYRARLNSKYAACIECHGDVEPFHTPAVISRIDEAKGLKPRLCIVCHGQKVHDIHWDLLEGKDIICDTCHSYRGEFTKPRAGPGQLLVCEVCHSGGNYIKIHIEGRILEGAPIDERWIKDRGGHQCDTCHVGDYDSIHFAPLKSWREEIEGMVEEAEVNPVQPLNISYL